MWLLPVQELDTFAQFMRKQGYYRTQGAGAYEVVRFKKFKHIPLIVYRREESKYNCYSVPNTHAALMRAWRRDHPFQPDDEVNP